VFDNDQCVMSMEADPHGVIYFSDPGGIFKLVNP
jgi:hypothetical protein